MATRFSHYVKSIPTATLASVVAAVPVAVWATDSLFSLYRVQGSSMEPSLHHGDILVVRKADGFWQKHNRKYEDEADPTLKIQRQKQIDIERTHCHSNGVSLLLHKPPIPVVNDIIIYKDPAEYPWRYSIKRVVGLGQQIVMVPSNRYPKSSMTRRSPKMSNSNDEDQGPEAELSIMRVGSACVPSYSLWVEGDNISNSKDSSTSHGPLSKKLLVGIAEYRIWPPTRIGKLGAATDLRRELRPYAYWPRL